MNMNAESSPRRILVTGDVVLDHFLYEGSQRRARSTIRLGTTQKIVPGGAALLFDLLQKIPKLEVAFGLTVNKLDGVIPKGYCVMQPCLRDPKTKDPKAKKEKVWRITQALGFDGVTQPLSAAQAEAENLAKSHDVAVIDDAGVEFRRWPSHGVWPHFVLHGDQELPAWLVLKWSSPIAAGDLWHTLTSGETQDIAPQEIRNPQELLRRTIAVVSINDLRVEPIHVTKALSWERAALDLTEELRASEHLSALRKLRFVVISLDIDGALLAEFPADGEPQFHLIFDPARLEGDFQAPFMGALFGSQTCLTAAIVAHLPPRSATREEAIEALVRGVKSGLCAMRRLLVDGHGTYSEKRESTDPAFPTAALAGEITTDKHAWSYGVTIVNSHKLPSDAWTIVAGSSVGKGSAPLWGLARRVAQRGTKELQDTPYLEFGQLFSIDRSEIESLRSLRRLMIDYMNDRKANKPLSIAAFGPPGAGKSFGVKQLAKAIFADDMPLLEFNLSQFSKPEELHGLFHQIRDRVLEGKLPLVFWDEFDSQDLVWLQLLLAPMQDGKFQEGQVTHPIGKSIFVFAGGTRYRFEDFGQPPEELLRRNREDEIDQWKNRFRAKKGPDFKSRLAGYINVLGPNRRDSQPNTPDDITFPVRRALLLRVHLGIDANAPLNIDPGLLTAFLEIDRYRHGARSLEKIAEQVRHASRTGEFGRSDLPPRSLLDLHVDAARFLSLLENAP